MAKIKMFSCKDNFIKPPSGKQAGVPGTDPASTAARIGMCLRRAMPWEVGSHGPPGGAWARETPLEVERKSLTLGQILRAFAVALIYSRCVAPEGESKSCLRLGRDLGQLLCSDQLPSGTWPVAAST